MRESTKSFDDDLMTESVVNISFEHRFEIDGDFAGKVSKEPDALPLVLEVFGMFKRQIEKHPLDRAKVLVQSQRQAFEAQVTSYSVKPKCRRSAPVNVARELISEENQRQSSTGR